MGSRSFVRLPGCEVVGNGQWISVLMCGVIAMAGAVPVALDAQQPTSPALVFDGVTVVDVEHGKLLPAQRVVIAGNRIQIVGDVGVVKTPPGAQVVDAREKYLIPGLWDMHTHASRSNDLFYPLFLATGVTGIRDAGSPVPLDTLRLWRREILAGTRIGPPRQILSGQSINTPIAFGEGKAPDCGGHRQQRENDMRLCVSDTADARYVVDSLKAAGADMIKIRRVSSAVYFAIAAEARRLGIPFGGHIEGARERQASDSGATILDHMSTNEVDTLCLRPQASVDRCRSIAERLRRNGTWWTPTLAIDALFWGSNTEPSLGTASQAIVERFSTFVNTFLTDSFRYRSRFLGPGPSMDSLGYLQIAQRVGLPIVAGTDVYGANMRESWSPKLMPGFSLHAELAMYVTEGLSPLEALRSATLNPAQALRATDSLGTIASGKLADLVLLDANPLADITNTTTIRAVVANGRYFDRAALDELVAGAQTKAKANP